MQRKALKKGFTDPKILSVHRNTEHSEITFISKPLPFYQYVIQ